MQEVGRDTFMCNLERYIVAMIPPQSRDIVDIVNTNSQSKRSHSRGFSLLEMMAVMVIMGVMLTLAAPALSSFKNTMGRKGAINQLLNSFEQARVAALTQGVNVYFGFADASSAFPNKLKCKAYIIFRDRSDTDPVGTRAFVPLTKWIQLPQGISFQKVNGDNTTLMADANLFSVEAGCLPVVDKTATIRLPVLTFNTSGYIEKPSRQCMRLLIYEGFHGPSGPNFTNPSNTKFDVIAFRRFSGRAELFLTAGN